jgi:hypothetical protein
MIRAKKELRMGTLLGKFNKVVLLAISENDRRKGIKLSREKVLGLKIPILLNKNKS